MDVLRGMSVGEWLLVALGLGLFGASGWVVWVSGRRLDAGGGGEARVRVPVLGSLSEPTRLLVGCSGLFLAYHLVVWALPAHLTPLQVPRRWWWVVALGGAALIAGSIGLDRADAARPRDAEGPGPD